MTRRATPPFRADHVGSLLRPATLLAARDDFAAGKIDAAALAAVEDEAIRDAVKLQEDAGLRSATDGEFRKIVAYRPLFRATTHRPYFHPPGHPRVAFSPTITLA